MPKHLFEYAIVRLVPQVEREEFLNVGVVLYCAKQQFLACTFLVDKDKLKAFSPVLDIEEANCYLEAFQRICVGGIEAGTIGKLPIAERFRWLTATRSTLLQTSKVHPGLCEHAGNTLQQIFTQLVV